MEVRPVKRDELESIYQLVIDLAIYEKEPEAVTAKLEDYETAFDEGLIDATVAVDRDKIVGMAIYYMTFSTWKGKMLYLEDFFVHPSYRAKGLGQQIFDTFIATAQQRNCSMVKWQVLDWNENAIRFYKRNNAVIEKEWYNGKIIF